MIDDRSIRNSGSATSFKIVLFDTTVSEDAGIEPRTVATLALFCLSDALATRLDLIHFFVPVLKLQFLMIIHFFFSIPRVVGGNVNIHNDEQLKL